MDRAAGAAGEPGRFGESLRAARRRGTVEPRPADRAHPRPAGARTHDGPLAPATPAAAAPEPYPVTPELAALVRALPVSMAAARAPREGSLALSFGRSLDVELRSGPEGIDLVLRPDDRLRSAAAAELPRIVAALGARGITVGRVEIRRRSAAPRGGRAR